MRVNVGCGRSPIPGWVNLDNSPTLWIAKAPGLAGFLRALGLLGAESHAFAKFASKAGIRKADARRMPLASGSVEVLYSSHMMEHLDRADADAFLREAARVLRPGGHLRLVLPDLSILARRYAQDRDADAFVTATRLPRSRPRRIADRIKWLLVGDREHLWMYDGASASKAIHAAGFIDIRILPPGETTIPDPAGLNLREREEESAYLEARKPG